MLPSSLKLFFPPQTHLRFGAIQGSYAPLFIEAQPYMRSAIAHGTSRGAMLPSSLKRADPDLNIRCSRIIQGSYAPLFIEAPMRPWKSSAR